MLARRSSTGKPYSRNSSRGDCRYRRRNRDLSHGACIFFLHAIVAPWGWSTRGMAIKIGWFKPSKSTRAKSMAKQLAGDEPRGRPEIRVPTILLAAGSARLKRMQLFAWLEANGLAGSDVDLSPGAGVAADAGFASADAEDAKSAQFDALAGCQGLLEALEDRVHCRLSLRARQARALDHVVNDVLLDQRSNLAGTNSMLRILPPTPPILQILLRLEKQGRKEKGTKGPGRRGPGRQGPRVQGIANAASGAARIVDGHVI